MKLYQEKFQILDAITNNSVSQATNDSPTPVTENPFGYTEIFFNF